MAPRLASLDGSLRLLALGGASAHAPADTDEAVTLAARLGAGGLETTVRLTADGVPVVSGAASVGGRLRRKRIGSLTASDLPGHLITLDRLYQLIDGAVTPLCLDLAEPEAIDTVVAAARRAGAGVEEQLWLRSASTEDLVAWRQRCSARLVSSLRLKDIEGSAEQWASRLRERGIEAMALPHDQWSGGMVALAHRFERYALARGAVHERELAAVIDIGVDLVSSRHVDRMAAVAELFYPAGEPDPER